METQLPKGWTKTTVGEVCTALQYGFTASAVAEKRGPKFLRITDIQNGNVRWETVPYCEVQKDGIEKYELKSGDIVFARTGGTVGKSYFISNVPDKAVFASYLIRLSASFNIYSKYLYYFFQSTSYWEQIGLKKGGLQGNVNAKALGGLEFLLPPLNEQKRIVAKIEELFSELDKGIESLQTAREQLKVYRQAVLKHAFEGKLTEQWRKDNADKLESPEQLLARIQQERDTRYQQQLEDWKTAVKEWETNGKEGKKPGKPKKSKSSVECFVESITVPNTWAYTSVGELNADIFDGPFGSNLKSNDYVDEGVRVIRLENIGMMQFIHDKYSFVTEEKYQQIKKHTVSAGDIIFSSFITEGIRVTQLPASIDRAINKADCFCIRLFGQSYSARFLTLYLSSRSAYHQVESAIHGIGRPRINTTQLKSFVVPFCSEAEQSQILAEIDRQMSEIDASDQSITEQLAKAETLRQSILKKAFSGQLVPQDPNDEPASELLARIQAERATLSAKAKKTPAKRGRKVKEVSN